MIILATTGSTLPFDTRQWRHLFYDSNDLRTFATHLTSWVHRTISYQHHNSRNKSTCLKRGDVFPDIVDATLYIDSSEEPIDDRIWRDVKSGSLIPCSYSYYTDIGTESWLKLCQDPLYKVYSDSVDMLTNNIDRILDALGPKFVESSPDFISLGPGNGHKDRVILRGLVRRLIDGGLAPELYYYPIDISPRMLTTAVRTVSSDADLSGRLRIKVAESDFENIAAFRPIYDYRAAPNLFSFLGNTLGNVSDEINLLQRIKHAMQPNDFMLLEVRLATGNINPGGNETHQLGLSFAPLQRLGLPFDKRLLNVGQSGPLSQIPGTRTTSVRHVGCEIRGIQVPNITLSCVNYYEKNELQRALTSSPLNFKVIDVIDTFSLVLFVLRNG